MKLRKLQEKDAKYMLEWMHDKDVVKYMQADFMSKTIEDCYNFINSSAIVTNDLHLAIIDDYDEYMGTVSLKHITEKDAEFAITIRSIAMGTGYSAEAMANIIDIGLNKMQLEKVYWCVDPVNIRAVRFYDKNGYKRFDVHESDLIGCLEANNGYTKVQIDGYLWYEVYRNK